MRKYCIAYSTFLSKHKTETKSLELIILEQESNYALNRDLGERPTADECGKDEKGERNGGRCE